jgi:hypothetical protein
MYYHKKKSFVPLLALCLSFVFVLPYMGIGQIPPLPTTATAKDTVHPKGVIQLSHTAIDGDSRLKFVFWDEYGKKTDEVVETSYGKVSFTDYCPYGKLKFPANHSTTVEEGDNYSHINISKLSEKEKVLAFKNAGVKDISLDIIKRTQSVVYARRYSNFLYSDDKTPYPLYGGEYNYITHCSCVQLRDSFPSFALLEKKYFTILDNNNQVYKQFGVEFGSENILSRDGQFFFVATSKTIFADEYEEIRGPWYVFDLKNNRIDTLDLKEKKILEDGPSKPDIVDYYIFNDFFCLFVDDGPEILHIVIEPDKRRMFLRRYNSDLYFKSLNKYQDLRILPNGQPFSLDGYGIEGY